jgi:hypothetical protein
MLHQKSLDPVVVTLLEDAISDRCGLLRDGEALAESLGEGLQQGARELADGAVQRADRGRIEGEQFSAQPGRDAAATGVYRAANPAGASRPRA